MNWTLNRANNLNNSQDKKVSVQYGINYDMVVLLLQDFMMLLIVKQMMIHSFSKLLVPEVHETTIYFTRKRIGKARSKGLEKKKINTNYATRND